MMLIEVWRSATAQVNTIICVTEGMDAALAASVPNTHTDTAIINKENPPWFILLSHKLILQILSQTSSLETISTSNQLPCPSVQPWIMHLFISPWATVVDAVANAAAAGVTVVQEEDEKETPAWSEVRLVKHQFTLKVLHVNNLNGHFTHLHIFDSNSNHVNFYEFLYDFIQLTTIFYGL